MSVGEMGEGKMQKWAKARAFQVWSRPGSCCWGWLHPSRVIRGQMPLRVHTPPAQVPTPPTSPLGQLSCYYPR